MHVIYVTPEVAPYSASGSLAEISSALPQALRQADVQVTVITPFYQGINPSRHGLAKRLLRIPITVGTEEVEVGVIDGKFQSADVSLLMVDHPESFDRPGLYGENGEAYPDNARRFYIFCAAVVGMIKEMDLRPDLVHAAGWQTGLLPLLLAKLDGEATPPVVFAVHDTGDLGLFPPAVLKELGLDGKHLNADGLELDGQVSLLKAGLALSAGVTTESPSLARGLCTEEHDHGLHEQFASLGKRLTGIYPGMEPSAWNPKQNHRLASGYDSEDLSGKASCKAELQKELGLAIKAELPLLAMVDELTLERGAGLVLDSLAALPPESYQLALVGEVAPDLSARLEALVGKHPEAVVHLAKVDEAGLHRLLAGADSVVLPISNGPGVLYHLKAMKYGTVPLCHEGQSHQDSVVNFDEATGSGTGITFSEPDEAAYTSALQRYILLYSREEQRTALSRNAMRHPFTWERTAGLYKQVYEGLL